ncbi:MAG: response regulator [Candidatus Thiodiazotropha sp.]
MRILLAEDDAVTRKIYYLILNKNGHEIDLAANGQEAVELGKIQGSQYNLCLMDMEMPVMGGLEAIRLLRQHNKRLRIVAMSSSPRYKEHSLAAGANEYWCKPVSKKQLLSLIE